MAKIGARGCFEILRASKEDEIWGGQIARWVCVLRSDGAILQQCKLRKGSSWGPGSYKRIATLPEGETAGEYAARLRAEGWAVELPPEYAEWKRGDLARAMANARWIARGRKGGAGAV